MRKKKTKEQNCRMYKFRIYPSRKEQVRLFTSLRHCKEIYNELLGLNKDLWITNKNDFNPIVTDMKIAYPDYYETYSQVLQNVSDRLEKAFNNFFDRCKRKCKKKGFPRFKSSVESITYSQSGFEIINDKRLKLSKVGNIPIILHRAIIGKIKTLTIKHHAGKWYAVFSCEIPPSTASHPSNEIIGVDVGLTNFAEYSNSLIESKKIPNPRFLRKAEKKLKRLQRQLSRKVKGSSNRKKAVLKLARAHNDVFNRRDDFLHKMSNLMTKKYKIICVEKLNIQNMLKNHNFAKSISDAGWGKFVNMLSYKAINCGGEVLKNPKTRGSSCRCVNCGKMTPMPLNKRIFECEHCGFILGRDHNASLNQIKDTAGLAGIKTLVDIEPLQNLSKDSASLMNEARTKNTVLGAAM